MREPKYRPNRRPNPSAIPLETGPRQLACAPHGFSRPLGFLWRIGANCSRSRAASRYAAAAERSGVPR